MAVRTVYDCAVTCYHSLMKIKNATVLFVLVPFILGTIMLCYCIWAVSTNKNYTIRETVSVGKEKLVWYTEKVKGSDVSKTRVQCIGSRKIFDPHQERYDIFIAEGTPTLSFRITAAAREDADSVTITVNWDDAAGLESIAGSSGLAAGNAAGTSLQQEHVVIRQKAEAHGITFSWQ